MTKEEKITIACGIATLLFIFWSGYTIGKIKGYSQGMDTANEIQRKVDCEFDYGYKPLEEVPARCLKYFNLEELKK